MRKCLILAAGKGSRMGNEAIHKGLLPISGKAIISNAFEYIKCEEFIIAVGYKSQQIIDYCACAHPDVKIKFVHVDNYDQPGSGPGYSMYCCRNELQEPFIITTADSFLLSDLPILNEDWIGVVKVNDPENYSTCELDEHGKIKNFQNKNENSKNFAFTGVMGVQDYTAFWNKFDNYFSQKNEKEVEAIGPLYNPAYAEIKGVHIDWKDTGRKSLYENLKKNSHGFTSYELPKINVVECTYKINNKVVKLATPQIISKKKNRSKLLQNLIPNICCKDYQNVMAYDFVNGKTLYENDNLEDYISFLNWLENNLFIPSTYSTIEEKLFKDFYYNKTIKRIEKFSEMYGISFNDEFIINQKSCTSVFELLKNIPWDKIIKNNIVYPFHGDLNFGNALIDQNGKFILIDWREDFEGYELGDLYYDLAKLYAGTAVNFMVASNKKDLISKEDTIKLTDCKTENTDKFLEYYENWIKKKGYDLNKVKLIAFLTYLNMSPLHPDDFGQYLFYKGILEINKIINHE